MIVTVCLMQSAIGVVNYRSFNEEIMAEKKADILDESNLYDYVEGTLVELKSVQSPSIDLEEEREKYLASIQSAIENTSGYMTSEKARQLADVIDTVTSDMEREYGFEKDVARVLAMISTESDFRNLSANEAEAVGYMQITPICLEYVNGVTGWNYTMADMQIAEANIRVGWYKYNKDKEGYGSDKATVAYNQGYNNLTRAVLVSQGDSTSYLYKVSSRRDNYMSMLEDY